MGFQVNCWGDIGGLYGADPGQEEAVASERAKRRGTQEFKVMLTSITYLEDQSG